MAMLRSSGLQKDKYPGRKFRALLLLFTLPFVKGSVSVIYAQQILSLEACVKKAFESRPDIRNAQLTLMATKAQIREGYSPYLPQASGTFTLDDNLKLQTSVIPAGIFGPEPINVRFGTTYMGVASAQVDQKVYDQGLITGFKAFKPALEAAVESITKLRNDAAYEVASAYVQAAVSIMQVAPLQEIKAGYERLLKIVELQKNEGFALTTDVERLQLALRNVEAQINKLNLQKETALLSLKAAMFVPETEAILPDTAALRTLLKTGVTDPPFDPGKLPEIRMINKNIMIQEVQMKRVRHGYIPTLGVYARYGLQALNNDFGNLWSRWYDFSSVGFRLSIPVFDGFLKEARYTQARIQWLQMQDQMRHTERLLKLQFDNAALSRRQSMIDLKQQELNLQLARNLLRQAQKAFGEGQGSLADVLNSEIQFQQALVNYHSTLMTRALAEISLRKAAGDLLKSLNLQ